MRHGDAMGQRAGKTALIRINPADISGGLWAREQDDSLALLMASIARHGLLQPVVVRETACAGRYALICGGRRAEACRRLGLKQIDAVLVYVDAHEAAACSMEEHHTSRGVHFLEEADVIRRHGGMQLAQRSALDASFFGRRLKLQGMGAAVCAAVRRARLSIEQAEPLMSIPGVERRLEAASLIAQRELTPWQARRMICGGGKKSAARRGAARRITPEEAKMALEEICTALNEAGYDAAIGITGENGAVSVHMTIREGKKEEPKEQPSAPPVRRRRRRLEKAYGEEGREGYDAKQSTIHGDGHPGGGGGA